MIDRVYYVRCDECMDRPREPAASREEARYIAETYAWARVGKRDLCPACFSREVVAPRATGKRVRRASR